MTEAEARRVIERAKKAKNYALRKKNSVEFAEDFSQFCALHWLDHGESAHIRNLYIDFLRDHTKFSRSKRVAQIQFHPIGFFKNLLIEEFPESDMDRILMMPKIKRLLNTIDNIVLDALMRGKSKKWVANRLDVSQSAVSQRWKRIMKKAQFYIQDEGHA